MNTYYLKKFRKEAQRVIKARYNPIQLDTRYPYDCTEKGYYIADSMATDLNVLKRKLLEFRRHHLLHFRMACYIQSLFKKILNMGCS